VLLSTANWVGIQLIGDLFGIYFCYNLLFGHFRNRLVFGGGRAQQENEGWSDCRGEEGSSGAVALYSH